MSTFTHLIEDGDICALIFLIGILVTVGRLFVARDPRLMESGLRVAAGTTVLYAGATLWEEGFSQAAQLARVVMRSLAAGGVVLGPVWIVLAIGAFLYQYYDRLISAAKTRAAARQREREREQREAEVREQQRMEAAEWERARPQREREAQESAAKAEVESRDKSAAQKRREDAGAACELAYALAAPEIASRFSKQDFAEFATKYMTDRFSPESVEERAEQLKAIIRQHQEKVVPTPKFRSIQELAVWFEQRKAEIEAISDARHRATLLVQLKERYSELTSQLLTEMTL